MNVELEISTFCPFRCAHCYIASDALGRKASVFDDVDFSRDLIASFVKCGFKNFTLTGGEPTVHRNFSNIVRSLSEQDCQIELFTNGIRGDTFWREDLFSKSIAKVQVSLYGFTKETYQKFTGHPDAFERVRAFIHAAINEGKKVSVQMPSISAFALEMPLVRSWVNETGLTVELFKIALQPASYDPLEQKSIDIQNVSESDGPGLICGAGTSSVRVSADGKLKGCHLHSDGIKIIDPTQVDTYLTIIRNVAKATAANHVRFCGSPN